MDYCLPLLLHSVRILAQKFPERDMTAQFLGICRADIQMMQLQMRFAGIAKGFPPFNAEVSLVDISNGCKPVKQ